MNYFDGLKEGVRRYAYLKDGVQHVGTNGETLNDVLKNIALEETTYYKEQLKLLNKRLDEISKMKFF